MGCCFDKAMRIFSLAAAVVFRFVIPGLLCIAFIIAAIADYDRRFPDPPDHFTPARAIATITILAATLLWLVWRFIQFVRTRSSSHTTELDLQNRSTE